MLKQERQVLDRNEQIYDHSFRKQELELITLFKIMRLYQLVFSDSAATFLVLITRRWREVKGLKEYLQNISTEHS